MNHLLTRHPQSFAVFLGASAFLFTWAAIVVFKARDRETHYQTSQTLLAACLRYLACAAAAIGILLVFSGCETPPTAEQIQAYSNAAHTVIQGGLQDYKTIVEVTHKPTPTPPQR